MACYARFEGKEGYMTFMNSFVEEHTPEMTKFLDQLSVKSASSSSVTDYLPALGVSIFLFFKIFNNNDGSI